MKIRDIFYLFAAISVLATGCSDDEGEGTAPEKGDRIAFRSDVLAAALDTDFETFRTENEIYATKNQPDDGAFVMGGYLKTDVDSILFRITVERNSYGKVGSISGAPENQQQMQTLWEYYMTNSETLGLGKFLGTKYRGATEGGVLQTIEESLQYVATNGTENLLMSGVFSVVPGKAYAVPTIENDAFRVQLMENYLTLDYAVATQWIGADYQQFAETYYILGNKMSLWGTNYIYFDYALDLAGNAFNVDVNGDAESAVITSVRASLDYGKYDAATQLAIWKSYAGGDAVLNLGTFKEAYRQSSFGGTPEMFDDAAAAIAYVEEHGRPGGFDPDVIVVYEQGGHTVTITLKSLYTYVDIQ